MQYNNRYRKEEPKSAEGQAFWKSMMDGLKAQDYVEKQVKKVNRIRNRSDNSYKPLHKTFSATGIISAVDVARGAAKRRRGA